MFESLFIEVKTDEDKQFLEENGFTHIFTSEGEKHIFSNDGKINFSEIDNLDKNGLFNGKYKFTNQVNF